MTLRREDLDKIQVASPCQVPWESMKGDDQVRHCAQCQLKVYNLSQLTLDEIGALARKQDGRVCVRFFRRFDGTVLTRDCPVGIRLLAAGMKRGWKGIMLALTLVAAPLFALVAIFFGKDIKAYFSGRGDLDRCVTGMMVMPDQRKSSQPGG